VGVVNINLPVPGAKNVPPTVGVIVDPAGTPVEFTETEPKKLVHETANVYVTVCPAEAVCGGLTVKLRVGRTTVTLIWTECTKPPLVAVIVTG
jgi:predicted transcriptional regulator